jgi:chromosome segregation ATPase
VIEDLEKELLLARGELGSAGAQLQRRTQDMLHLDKEYSALLKDYDSASKEKALLAGECGRLEAEAARGQALAAGLREEVDGLKEVLIESSLEMERCRDELIKGERDREVVRLERDEAELRIEKLERLLSDREKEAERWRDNYYAIRNKY